MTDEVRQAPGPRGIAILMRHGETPWNREGRVMGHREIELDAAGRAQVEATVPFARLINPDLIVTSPLARARQSAEIVSQGLDGVRVVEEPQIVEVHYGRWEGLRYDELFQDQSYLIYRRDPVGARTPGGESVEEVQRRGVEAVLRMLSANPDQRVLFVSHGDIIRTVLCHFMALDLKHFRRLRVDNAAFSALRLFGSFAEVKFLNLLPNPARAFAPPFQMKSRKKA